MEGEAVSTAETTKREEVLGGPAKVDSGLFRNVPTMQIVQRTQYSETITKQQYQQYCER